MRLALLIFTILVAGSSILWLETDGFQAFTSERARRLAVTTTPKPLPIVTLQDQNGREFGFADYNDRVVLVDFIYTRCPTMCPIMGARFRQLHRSMENISPDKRFSLLSISFDPEHDTVAVLSSYADAFGADGSSWRMARVNDQAELDFLLKELGVVVIPDQFGGYQHNAAIHVIDRGGRVAHILDYDVSIEQIQQVVQQL